MPLGTGILGFDPGDVVLDGDTLSPPKGAQQLPTFGPCLLTHIVKRSPISATADLLRQVSLVVTSATDGPTDKQTTLILGRQQLSCIYIAVRAMRPEKGNKSSAVAETDDSGHNRHGRKRGGRCCCAPFAG